ncbi:hypothetical protein ACHAXA_004941 [Cyclostephanos tholiformis]|uniref:Vta1/callose synthase N-terminal domain-containing protein n=1 Tax=Cyclostephanos tholiformis TaxID=382380 RepID=A0ABD3RS25_9STRA
MGIAFGVRLLLALHLHPIILSARNYCHAVVDAILPPAAMTGTTTLTNDVSEKTIPRDGRHHHHRAIAGGTSRALAQAMLYPLDALRTLSQTRDGRTLADVGLRSLLNGCVQTSTVALFTGAFQFGLHDMFEPRLGPLASSALAATGSCLVSVPQEVVKQRLVTGVYGNFRSAVTEIWRTEGAFGFYSGWKPTMTRNVPFVVATFASRDALRSGIAGFKRRWRIGRDPGWVHDGVDLARPRTRTMPPTQTKTTMTTVAEDVGIGIASALISCVLTQPMDVVKTRMMTQAASRAIPYTTALECATSILRTEGWRRFYSGVGQRGMYMGGLWGLTFGLEPMYLTAGTAGPELCNFQGNMAAVPPSLKKIKVFLTRAEELDRDRNNPESRVVAYNARQYAVLIGIPLAGQDGEAKSCISQLLTQLEKEKDAMSVFSKDEHWKICRKVADRVFDKADAEDRAGMATKGTAKSFYAAGTFYEILQQYYGRGKEGEGDADDDATTRNKEEEEKRRVYSSQSLMSNTGVMSPQYCKSSISSTKLSKEKMADAIELTKFALAALQKGDADLGRERLEQALVLWRR